MKKKLGYLLLAITIAVLVLYLFRYKRSLIIENKIPITATEILQIDLRQIEHHLLVDAIKNPFKYISFKSKEEKHKSSFNNAFVIPRNLFFFSNKSNFKGAWFSNAIKIKDHTELRDCLLQEGFKESTDKKLELFSKGKIVIAVSGEKVLIVYKKQQHTSVNTAIQTVFKETNFYKKDKDLLKLISNSKSDITYASLDDDLLEADFKKGLFEIKGTLRSNLFITDTYFKHSDNSIGFFASKINKDHHLFSSFILDKNKKKFDNFTKLSMDSIVDNWNGNITFNLKAITKEVDTIVTYEYDDDFNKIEKKSVQKLNTPNTTITLGNEANLYEYFYKNKAIQIIENDTLFASIPIYKMYARRQDSRLTIFTKKQFRSDLLKEETYKLKAYIDINGYLANPLEFSLTPIKKDYLQLLRHASAKLTINDELLIQVSLKEHSRNFLGQFIKP
ncbi:hypothetical protein Q4Q39_10240 [Flavivirga amylovorans]|uniref:DUF3352 domain-containing protein n=1 Tax=Flavivirga amylovorans TaxID=870486 RepID=A0ABT8X1F5_9FLAO|nr:hypothetical protein [Flavivirga amylovorans]MDO5987778.1 hypothetical protein [Flavivirga amylovorans]